MDASGLAPDDIIASMEMLNDMRRCIAYEDNHFMPAIDFWLSVKAVSDQLQEMAIFRQFQEYVCDSIFSVS